MIAQITTFQGASIGLLAAQPNWATEVKISLEIPTDIAKEPITFNESRRAFAQTARYTMKWRTYLSSAQDSTELRIFLTRLRGEPVAVPLWTDGCEIAASVPVGATVIQLLDAPVRYGTNWIIANDEFSSWEIVTTGAFTPPTGPLVIGDGGGPEALDANGIIHLSPGTLKAWPAGTLMYPLLFGRLADRPKPEWITDERLDVDLKIKENSQFSRRLSPPAAAIPLVGNRIPPFATTPLWTIPPNFSRPLDWTEQPDIVYQEIGFLRQEQQRAYDHRNARGVELEFSRIGRAELTNIERFWRDRRGNVLRFMLPTWRGDMRMAANTPVPLHPTWITVEPVEYVNPGREPQPGDPYIALIDANDAVDPYQIGSTLGVNLVALRSVTAHTAAATILSNLLLARFSEAKLEWTYLTANRATTRIKFQELPHEYAHPPAPLQEPAYLFIFTEEGVRVDRFTSYENTIVIPSGAWAGTYQPAPFSFDSDTTGLKLDQEKLDFKSFRFAGNPLLKMFPFALDGMLTLDVVEVNSANPTSGTAVVRFSGDVWSVDSDFRASALAFGNFFERKFPRFLLSVADNYTQFTPPTKITAGAFVITGNIAAKSGQTLNVTSASGSSKPADYFSGGRLDTGVGANLERRSILHSHSIAGGVALHIDRPLLKSPLGQSLSMYPGYDGSITQCETRFNNRINFGGHPFMPNVNPAVRAMKPKQVEGGKK
jgi:hypothetical protein